ncbi:hypothetical protein [uncultured Photobacterium sp.]|uniref:hypothetical protein n=1 Tax=uncultured Photobacterium sp. TaxID=173973 RepID=UPI002601C2B3|nr:hypothetical protein [uncultured Photobacterium sp.]
MLEIDAAKAVEAIEQYVSDLLDERNKNCIVMGLSGGIDSAVLITLAVRAVGAKRVKAFFLKDRDSENDSEIKARVMADWLGIELQVQDISSKMKSKGVYDPFIMRVSKLSGVMKRFLLALYSFIFRETVHLSTIKGGCGQLGRNPLKKLIYYFFIVPLVQSFNTRHIYRRTLIEKEADKLNGVVIGAANYTEAQAGWFVKEGIDDMPIQPMAGLFKTQIWQLAEYLGLPLNIRQQLPSPDMVQGVTSEISIGIAYRRFDIIFDYIERGIMESEIIAKGVSEEELDHVRDIQRFSAWMRESPHEPPPITGKVGSPYRTDLCIPE